MDSRDGQFNVGTIFITGISASGKSTLGKLLFERLRHSSISNVELLDGEEVRQRLEAAGRHYGRSTADRNAVAIEIAEMASDANEKGYVCIVCTIGHHRQTRERVRERIGRVFEVYLDCPVEVCAERDRKGHYAKALAGYYDNFIGVTEPYQRSEEVELTLNTDRNTIDECSSILLSETLSFLRDQRGAGASA